MSETASSIVQLLPDDLANQIAAGEVIERPASVVKELVENSLDAGATRIFVDIEDGGTKLIRVTDDGSGMSRDDAVLCLARHATSKIQKVEDLFDIRSLGFRGEAIPSIASVSRFVLETQQPGAISGTHVEVVGGKVGEIRDAGLASGTVVEVRDLFFNTPARLKFLKTTPTEVRHISEALMRMGLSRHDVHLRLRHNNRLVTELLGCSNRGDRVLGVFGREARAALFDTAVLPPLDGIEVSGFFSRPDYTQRTTSRYFVFVNGRYVRDKTLRAAISGAYRGVLEKGRYPMVVLFVTVPPHLIDVNVHPSKIEVRFGKTDSAYRAVYHAIRDALEETPWVDAEARPYLQRLGASGGAAKISPGDPATIEPLDARSAARAQHLLPLGADRPPGEPIRVPISEIFGRRQRSEIPGAKQPEPATVVTAPRRPAVIDISGADPVEDRAVSEGYFSRLTYIGQFKRTYLVCSDASGLVIVDQHAAHERIAFERLKVVYADEHRQSQALLVPERISLDTIRAAVMAATGVEFFAKLGFEIEPFGGNDYALKAVPAVLVGAGYGQLVRDVLDDLGHVGKTTRVDEARDAIFARMACHAVLRAGDDVSETEARELFRQMDSIDFGANCPHGRPVYYRLPVTELEDAFGRT